VKILWHSNAPWAPTGYGVQTALFAPRLRDIGHDVAISAYYGLQGSTLEWNGFHCYPSDPTGYGRDLLPHYAAHHADGQDPRDVLVLTLMDVWVLNEAYPALRELNMASWVPVDHGPLPTRVHEFFELTGARPIAMSRFGERALRDAGHDPLYVPHGVDTKVYRPQPEHRAIVRRGMGVPEDAFVIGMVANNAGQAPPRKAFPQVFQAFAAFRREHPEAILHLHTEIAGRQNGINLSALADICGVPAEAISITNQFSLHLGIPDDQMALIYSGFDVLASPSYGEGFGVPIVEAQACGVPVIVTDWTAMPELCGAGWKVRGDKFYDPPQGAFYVCPAVIEILDAFDAAHAARNDYDLKAKAREFALQYDADRVVEEHWKPALAALEGPREVPPLPTNGNRAQRRAKQKAKAKAAR
jgi:glycosyltransferase involved in cell wall biosynthesis